MPLPLTMPLAISAIKAVLKFRGQVDAILSLNEASAPLPFALPPVPTDDAAHLAAMPAFFKTERGQLILSLRDRMGDFTLVEADPNSTVDLVVKARERLFALFYEASGVTPKFLGPVDPAKDGGMRGLDSPDMRLAYYVVQSQRLSKNSALVRVILVTTDTLLEFAGENANLFISNPNTRSLVESLIDEFAGKRDFDDAGAEEIFKTLLGATIVAFADHPPSGLANQPALKAVFAALGDVRVSLGNDFVAKIISIEGFEGFVAATVQQVAKDPSFLTRNALAQKVLTATLTEIHQNFSNILDDPKALLGVLQTGIGAAAADVSAILEKELGGKPLLPAVLAGVLKEVGTLAQSHALFASIANGQVLPDIYKTTLKAIAANPLQFASDADVRKFVSGLIAGLADALSDQALSKLFTRDTLKLLASESLVVLAADPKFIAKNNEFATKMLAAIFKASATAIGDGLSRSDLLDIATAALNATRENLALLDLDDRLAAAITSAGDAIAAAGLARLLDAQGRKALLLSVLQTAAANPAVWGQWQQKGLVQPVVQGILQGLATDPTHLLSGPVLVSAVSKILQAALRRGGQFVDQKVTPEALKTLLNKALIRANTEVGKTVDGENLPAFLARLVALFLPAPFALGDASSIDFNKLVDLALAQVNA